MAKLLSAAVLAVTTGLVLMAGSAQAKFTTVNPITKTFNVEGQNTTLTITPDFAISGSDGLVRVDLNAIVDATDLQGDLMTLMNKRWKYQECGERFSTRGATIQPAGDGRLHIGITAQAELWKCVKTKLPTRNLFHWEMVTAKTKLISQSVRIEALIRPIINGDGNTITAEVQVTRAMPDGLARTLTNAFGLHGQIKGLVQHAINGKLRGQQFRLPEEVRAYNVAIHGADFIDLGDGRLGVKLSGSGSITQNQLGVLINQQLSKLN